MCLILYLPVVASYGSVSRPRRRVIDTVILSFCLWHWSSPVSQLHEVQSTGMPVRSDGGPRRGGHPCPTWISFHLQWQTDIFLPNVISAFLIAYWKPQGTANGNQHSDFVSLFPPELQAWEACKSAFKVINRDQFYQMFCCDFIKVTSFSAGNICFLTADPRIVKGSILSTINFNTIVKRPHACCSDRV